MNYDITEFHYSYEVHSFITKKFKKKSVFDSRAKAWLLACGREDLLNKVETLHKSHRLCGKHFEEHMFKKTKENYYGRIVFQLYFWIH